MTTHTQYVLIIIKYFQLKIKENPITQSPGYDFGYSVL